MMSVVTKESKKIFEFSGDREAIVTAERAEALIKAIDVEDPCHIHLSNKSFSSIAAICVAKLLSTFKNIEIADISDIIAGRAEEDALLTLKTICESIVGNKLIELNVSDNALGSKGVTACQSLFSCKSLKRLYACNNGLSADACVLVSELLLSGGCPALTTLHFFNNMSGDGGAVAIAGIVEACPLLEDFRFSATRSSFDGCLAVAKALTTLSTLRRLDLQDNSFSKQAAVLLASSIISQPSLVHLNLRDAGLKEKGATAVIKALVEGKPSLAYLDLSGNDVTPVQAKELRSLLQCSHMSSLKELLLDDNELESEGAITIAEAVKGLTNLEILSVCTCEITASGAFVLARAVAELPYFRTFKVNENQICFAGMEAITVLLHGAGKELGDTDDNDEDGDESGFPELLEAAKKEDEVKKAERIKIGKTVVAGGDAVESAGAAKADEKAEEGTAVGPLSMGAVDEEDALVSAMQSASISGSRISDMPTP